MQLGLDLNEVPQDEKRSSHPYFGDPFQFSLSLEPVSHKKPRSDPILKSFRGLELEDRTEETHLADAFQAEAHQSRHSSSGLSPCKQTYTVSNPCIPSLPMTLMLCKATSLITSCPYPFHPLPSARPWFPPTLAPPTPAFSLTPSTNTNRNALMDPSHPSQPARALTNLTTHIVIPTPPYTTSSMHAAMHPYAQEGYHNFSTLAQEQPSTHPYQPYALEDHFTTRIPPQPQPLPHQNKGLTFQAMSTSLEQGTQSGHRKGKVSLDKRGSKRKLGDSKRSTKEDVGEVWLGRGYHSESL